MAPARTGAAPWLAILLMLLAVALLSAMDGVVKHLMRHDAALTVTAGRYLFALPFAALFWWRAGARRITAPMWRAHGLRGLVIATSASLFFWSLSVLPLVDVIVLAFVAPLLVPFVAWLVLGERVRLVNLATVLAGFAGVAVAVHEPGGARATGSEAEALGVAAVLGSAVLYALSVTLLRQRAGQDGTPVVGLLATLIPGAILLGPALVLGGLPSVDQLGWYLLMGVLAAGGMALLIEAYGRAEAQVLAPFDYSALLWAALIGFVVFAEVPQAKALLGGVIIIAACLTGSWLDGRRPRG